MEFLVWRHFRPMNLTIHCLANSDESNSKVDSHDKDYNAEVSEMVKDTFKGIQEEQPEVDKLVKKIVSDTEDNDQSAAQAAESSLSNDLRKSQDEQEDNKCTLSNLGQRYIVLSLCMRCFLN